MKKLLSVLVFVAFVSANAQALTLILNNNENVAGTRMQVLSYSPADRETLKTPPANVSIKFTKAPRPDKSSIKITDEYSNEVGDGSVTIHNSTMVAATPHLAPGHYRVRWRAVCACDDDNELENDFSFSVQ